VIAATWNVGENPRIFTDAEFVQMGNGDSGRARQTDNKIGRLERHDLANLVIIQSEETDAYNALVMANPADVGLVVIGGDLLFMATRICCAACHLQPNAPKPWKDAVAALKKH
jgi:hypothetical protein